MNRAKVSLNHRIKLTHYRKAQDPGEVVAWRTEE